MTAQSTSDTDTGTSHINPTREELLAEANQLRRTGLISEVAFRLIEKYDQALSLADYHLTLQKAVVTAMDPPQ